MYQNILVTSGDFEDFKSYGIKGCDEGVDIFCVHKETKLRHFIQCKRYKNLDIGELKKIVDRIIEGKNDYQDQVITVVTSCDIRRDAQDEYEQYALNKGFHKAIFIGRISLDAQLHLEKFDRVRERFFGTDISKEDKARQLLKDRMNGESLVQNKLLRKLGESHALWTQIAKDPSLRFKETKVIIRSIYDDEYPDSKDGTNYRSWFTSFLHDLYDNGIQLLLCPWTDESILVNEVGCWVLKKDIVKNPLDGEIIELKANIIGRVPYNNIMEINEYGDNRLPYPHLFCNFSRDKSLYTEICYEYHDHITNRRIMFEHEHKALISKYEFQQLKIRQKSQ